MSSFSLKILACIFMLIDHIGLAFFPKISILRAIGRLAFPIFAFQLGVGFEKTKSKEKYIMRMILFTIISQIPFYLFLKASLGTPKNTLNVGATLTCGLLILYCFEKIKTPIVKYLCIIGIFLISIFIPMDYGWYGVLTIIIFFAFRKDKLATSIWYTVLLTSFCHYKDSQFNMPAIFALIPICLFNGKKGKNASYLFYIFYPLHMMILTLIIQMKV